MPSLHLTSVRLGTPKAAAICLGTPLNALLTLAAAAAVIAGVVAVELLLARPALPAGAPPLPTVRTYHMAVEEVLWRYAPSGWDNCSGLPAAASARAATFIAADPAKGFIGDTYWRQRYVSYEPDGAFSTPRAGDWWPHAGIQGPTLRASVGEVLRVQLLNRGRFPTSLHLHGVPLMDAARVISLGAGPSAPAPAPTSAIDALFSFLSAPTAVAPKGALLLTAPSAPSDPFSSGARASVCTGAGCAALGASSLLVAPGETLELSWALGEEVGPAGAAGSVGRLYSALTYDGHEDPGLAGVLVVTPRGADATRPPADAAAEALAFFSVSMESASPYLPLNVLDFVWRARLAAALGSAAPAATGTADSAVDAAAAAAAAAAARLATKPSSPHLPVPIAATPAGLLAALYNAAVGAVPAPPVAQLPKHNHGRAAAAAAAAAPIDASHPAVLAALGAAAGGLTQGQTTLLLPSLLLGVSLGREGAVLRSTPALGATAHSFLLLNASAFVAQHSQATLESAIAPLALAALQGEPAFSAADFALSNTLHGVNGLLYCNRGALPGAALPAAVLGANTRWYVAVLGAEVDLHAVHWHGNTVLERAAQGAAFRSDSIALLPRQIATADMTAHAPGRWLLHCHVTDHIEAGMLAMYEVGVGEGGNASAWAPVFPGAGAAGAAGLLPLPPPALAPQLAGGRLREYFIQAEEGNWSYLRGPLAAGQGGGADSAAVDGRGTPLPPCGTLYYSALDDRYNGSFSWSKARFVRYTDATFSTPWAPASAEEAAQWAHLGLLGPVLRGEVGDTLRVWFRNGARAHFSMHPHGVLYAKGSEGAPYADGTAGVARDRGDDMVAPGAVWPYTWFLPPASGPGPQDPSSIPWLYHGHVKEAGDENTGLVGVLLVTGRGKARVPGSLREADLRPADVDRELVVLAKVFNEGVASREVHDSGRLMPVPAPGSLAAAAAAEDPAAFSTFYTLNGLVACRLRLTAVQGERVRLYGVSLGSEVDLHTLGISGHALSFRGRQAAGLSLLPGTMYAADTVAVGGGGWLLSSSVLTHAEQGMVARFEVGGAGEGGEGALPPPMPAPGGAARQYYIAAREVEWDYAPAGTDLCVGEGFKGAAGGLFPPLPPAQRLDADGTDLQGFPASMRAFVARSSGGAIGRRFRKARYLGFSDATFATPLHNAHNSSTGLLGPALRAAPGDLLVIVLRNELNFPTNLAFSAAPLQLVQLRERQVGSGTSEWGSALAGTPSQLAARPLEPGWEAEATWTVPASAAPGPADPPTIAWTYTSAISQNDAYAGLVGGLVVGASAQALRPGAPAHGAQREYLLAWYIVNENRSPLFSASVQRYAPSALGALSEAAMQGNLKHAVSGRLACNLEGLVAERGERVRLHLLGLGGAQDMHTPQAHGNMLGWGGGGQGSASHVAALGVHPGTRATVDLVAATGGKWLLECGVNDHWAAGMRALLEVREPGAPPAPDAHVH